MNEKRAIALIVCAMIAAFFLGSLTSGVAQVSSSEPRSPQSMMLPWNVGAVFKEAASSCPRFYGMIYSSEHELRIFLPRLFDASLDMQRDADAGHEVVHLKSGACRYAITLSRQELVDSKWVNSKLRD